VVLVMMAVLLLLLLLLLLLAAVLSALGSAQAAQNPTYSITIFTALHALRATASNPQQP